MLNRQLVHVINGFPGQVCEIHKHVVAHHPLHHLLTLGSQAQLVEAVLVGVGQGRVAARVAVEPLAKPLQAVRPFHGAERQQLGPQLDSHFVSKRAGGGGAGGLVAGQQVAQPVDNVAQLHGLVVEGGASELVVPHVYKDDLTNTHLVVALQLSNVLIPIAKRIACLHRNDHSQLPRGCNPPCVACSEGNLYPVAFLPSPQPDCLNLFLQRASDIARLALLVLRQLELDRLSKATDKSIGHGCDEDEPKPPLPRSLQL
mmetsp:Transcript_33579/g.84299  ORF Transcript_33579/g.84299 Transcript_33579/m.84299 type:complete len:258 (-) Transcript_33579:427-1200(-)